MVVILLHGGAAIADLHRIGLAVAARAQRKQRERGHEAERTCQDAHGVFLAAVVSTRIESTLVESAVIESAGAISAVESSIIAGCGATNDGKVSGAVP